jgi:hypothetical protein
MRNVELGFRGSGAGDGALHAKEFIHYLQQRTDIFCYIKWRGVASKAQRTDEYTSEQIIYSRCNKYL